MDPERLRDKFRGSMLGTAIGGALGMPIEGWTSSAITSKFGEIKEMMEAKLGRGTYTDDTQMMIGVGESLVRSGGFDEDDMATTFLGNYDPHRGYGGGTVRAFHLLEAGYPWHQVENKVFGGGSFGNGSAMRMAPVGALYYDDAEILRRVSFYSSSITHAHPLAKEGGALQAYATAQAIAADSETDLAIDEFIHKLIRLLCPSMEILRERLEQIEGLVEKRPGKEEIIALLGNDSRVFNSVPTAIYAFLSHYKSFEKTVSFAVSLGGDTDTIGAMSGAMSGAYHGKKGIPPRWLHQLENGEKGRDYIEMLADRLWRMKQSGQGSAATDIEAPTPS